MLDHMAILVGAPSPGGAAGSHDQILGPVSWRVLQVMAGPDHPVHMMQADGQAGPSLQPRRTTKVRACN